MFKKLIKWIKSIPADKVLHCLVSIILFMLVFTMIKYCLYPLHLSDTFVCAVSASMVILSGLGKEVYDATHVGYYCELGDIIADVIGVVIGVILVNI